MAVILQFLTFHSS